MAGLLGDLKQDNKKCFERLYAKAVEKKEKAKSTAEDVEYRE